MGLVGDVAKTAVVAGTWTAVSNGVSRRQAGRWAAQQQGGPMHGYRPPPPGRYQRAMFQQHTPPPPQPRAAMPVQAAAPLPAEAMNIRLAQLQQLGALRAQGVLSNAEFEAQKRQILGN